jgi:hypothetical protein
VIADPPGAAETRAQRRLVAGVLAIGAAPCLLVAAILAGLSAAGHPLAPASIDEQALPGAVAILGGAFLVSPILMWETGARPASSRVVLALAIALLLVGGLATGVGKTWIAAPMLAGGAAAMAAASGIITNDVCGVRAGRLASGALGLALVGAVLLSPALIGTITAFAAAALLAISAGMTGLLCAALHRER